MREEIPDIVIGRLPIYLRTLNRMLAEGDRTTTSSQELGERLGISSAQIRKDLSHFGEFGKQGTGYHISYLIEQLRQILKLKQEWKVALVGAGYLGHALAHYGRFETHGFRIAWIFDNDPAKIGVVMNGIMVQSDEKMEAVLEQEGATIAILAIPTAAAQEVTDRLVAVGVKAILNYAPISLNAPPDVHVQYSDPVLQLQRMTYYLEAD